MDRFGYIELLSISTYNIGSNRSLEKLKLENFQDDAARRRQRIVRILYNAVASSVLIIDEISSQVLSNWFRCTSLEECSNSVLPIFNQLKLPFSCSKAKTKTQRDVRCKEKAARFTYTFIRAQPTTYCNRRRKFSFSRKDRVRNIKVDHFFFSKVYSV